MGDAVSEIMTFKRGGISPTTEKVVRNVIPFSREPRETPNCQTTVSEEALLVLKLPATFKWLIYFTRAEAGGVIVRKSCASD